MKINKNMSQLLHVWIQNAYLILCKAKQHFCLIRQIKINWKLAEESGKEIL